jgi:CheY-like chemotaxis protein
MAGRATILVVDDDPSIRSIVARILRREEYEVGEASDGREALEKMRAGAYDAVVLDLMMPVMDGFEVVHYLERHEDAGTPCVIIMSAAVERSLQTAESPRVHALVRKPFELPTLVAAVENCTSRHGKG